MHVLIAVNGVAREIDKFVNDLSAKWLPAGSAFDGKHDIMQLGVREFRFFELCFPESAKDQVMGILYPCEFDLTIKHVLQAPISLLGYRSISKTEQRTPKNYRDIIDHQYLHVVPLGKKKDKYVNGVEVV